MKSIPYIAITLLTAVAMLSCKKTAYPVYDASTPFVNVWLGTSAYVEDSVVYNFSLKPDRAVDSVMFTARLMGLISDKDRSFTLKAVGGDTNKIRLGVHYKFGQYKIAANSYTAVLPIYILKSSDFADTSFSIRFAVAAGSELPAGVSDMQAMKVVLADRFQKPANWDAETSSAYTRLASLFKSFSKVKFQFITNVTGVPPTYRVRYSGTAVPPDEIPYTQYQYYSNTCKTALLQYNATHTTPLTDETGQAISF
ncbi:DUF4843 domain-containing protein [Filimonas effusa]|uniref:DUF4843 domain-containing protein n=1 Tax=Filimonas effusa TaxID=2508721 RepID=A0A4Q1D2Y6_9BACT|nr:DUF4843 domain-containing protein [Filimonas effusa]RXK81451.1 DUF4843 domain-containing protein [Filimonas effusa]